MTRNRVIYNTEALYIGCCPSSGYHFISGSGILNDSYTNLTDNKNLLNPIHRVQSVSYSYNIDYNSVAALGKAGYISRPIINSPSVGLAFNYLNVDLVNELRLGFNCNYTDADGSPFYTNNYSINLLSGLMDKQMLQPSGDPWTPLSTTDKRNIFVVVGPEGYDIMYSGFAESHKNNPNYYVYGFGDCYITSYSTQGAVGTFPVSSASFICDNLAIYASGSGNLVPALDPKTKSGINKHFIIPSLYEGDIAPAALLPGDITLNFSSTPKLTGVLACYGTGLATNITETNIKNIGVSFNDMAIQSYEWNLNLDRNTLHSIGYKLPPDRIIRNPVLSNISIGLLVRDAQTGSLDRLVNLNDDYNITIKIKNPANRPQYRQGTAIQYDFRRAKFRGVSYENAIGQNKLARLDFINEFNSDGGNSPNIFISGLLNIEFDKDYLLTVNDPFYFLLDDNGYNRILSKKAKEAIF